jgi:hypothetical protein
MTSGQADLYQLAQLAPGNSDQLDRTSTPMPGRRGIGWSLTPVDRPNQASKWLTAASALVVVDGIRYDSRSKGR